ncbi:MULTISPECIES: DUF3140 domain-containing protein [unclassified Streptomyces]|uniref:DUF3140 domain-containing protein n=1 Tax=unclassified Streptomyces TaxID=2593676 RepID=UPI003801179E
MTDALERDTLWEEFHRVVNMTSQELAAWLQVREADEEAAPLPREAGGATGDLVLAILQKRRADLTDDDVRVMYGVVDTVTEETDRAGRDAGHPPVDEDTGLRHRLMALGHDPLRT